ncbi:hypothetical protein JCM16303_006335 [Sporobolomyces ruberrimus]
MVNDSSSSSSSRERSVIVPSSSSSSSLPQPPTIQLEDIYDSPERTRKTYTLGSHRISVEDGEEGDLGGTGRGKDRKGKGKQVEVHEEGEEGSEEEEEVIDEAAEERKIQENLAKWSKADSKRRASIRRSQHEFVTPTILPGGAPPIPSLPSPTALIRRTSTMIRNKTGRRSRGTTEGDGVMELESSTGSNGTERRSRKGRRKDSNVLERGRDGFVSPDSVLELPLVEGETPPLSPTYDDAARTSNASGSRFIEGFDDDDDNHSTRSSISILNRNQNPFSPPITPVKDPFSDSHSSSTAAAAGTTIYPDSTPRATSHLASRPSQSMSDGRPSIDSFESSTSSNATFSDRTRGGGRGGGKMLVDQSSMGETRYDSYDPTHPTSPPQIDSPPLKGVEGSRFRESSMASSPLVATPKVRRITEEDEENEEVRNTVGLLDWLLCGCWRPRGRDSRGERGGFEEQQGRTNPME